MTVEEAIDHLKRMPPDAHFGMWQYISGVMVFKEINDIKAEVVKAQVHVGIEFSGKRITEIAVKDWPKKE